MFDLASLSTKISENLFSVISVPLIAALIGWITNYIAVKMIFRPRKPFNLLGYKVHGLIPKRQKELAARIGETVANDLVLHEDIQKVIHGPEVIEQINVLLTKQIDKFIAEFANKNPMIGMVLKGPLIDQVRSMLLSQIQSSIPQFLDSVMTRVEQKLDFKQVVQERIEGFDLSKLEGMIYAISAKELKAIELLGGVLGFAVGLLQVAIILAS